MLRSDLLQQLASLSDAEGGVLGNIVVTATLDPANGALGKVAGVMDKFKKAIEDGHVPRIKAFAVSNAQVDVLNESGIEDHKSETASPRLLQSANFTDLVVKLAGLRHTRIGVKPYDYRRVLDTYKRIDFVGREWLFERIAQSLQAKDRGFIVLTAGPGFGKTAFVLEFIERFKDTGIGTTALGAWHILRKTQSAWVPAISMVEQLEWRLRDRLGCPLGADGAKDKVDDENVARILQTALTVAAAKLGPEQRLILVIDGIDEAFGVNSTATLEQLDLLQRMFPEPSALPKGVFVLFASRPGAHLLGWLNDEADVIDVDHGDASLLDANRADLKTYLERKLKDVASPGGHDPLQNLIPALAERMTDACEGGFYVAEWFARKAKDLGRFERWLAGEVLQRGIDETLLDDWKYKPTGLDRTEKTLLPVLATAIAIWHEAGSRVTQDVIVKLFEAASDATLVNGITLPVGRMSARQIEREGVVVCLDKLRDWFDGGADRQKPVYTFRHSRIAELILEKIIDARTQTEVHRLLAWTSAKWRVLEGESRESALANAPWHQVLAKNLDAAMQLLADPCDPYLATVYAELETAVPVLARNYAAAIQLAATQEPDTRSSTKSNEPPALMHLRDVWRVLSQYGESLRKPECPLAPTLYNHLAAALDPKSDAYRKLVQAAESYKGTWLQRLNPEPLDRRLIAVLSGHTRNLCVDCVVWSPDGRRLASGSDDGTLRLWDGQTGAPLGSALIGHTDTVKCIVWSPDGTRLASGSRDSSLRLWDARTGASIGDRLIGHTGGVTCVGWSPDGMLLASGSADRDLRLWDGQTGAAVGDPLTGHTDEVRCIVWSQDGSHLVSDSKDGSLRLWDVQTGVQEGKPLTWNTHWLSCLAWSWNGIRFATGHDDGGLFVWDGQTGALVGESLTGQSRLAWSPDGTRLAIGLMDGSLCFWYEQTRTQLSQPLTGHTDGVHCLAWSPDGDRLASGSLDGTVCLWNGQTGAAVGDLLIGHTHWVRCLAWSPDGRLLVSGSRDGSLRLWDGKTEVLDTSPLPQFADRVICLAWSQDARQLASSSDDCSLRLWDGQTAVPLGEPLMGHTTDVQCIAWSPDGMRLASSSDDGVVRLWNGQTGAPLCEPVTRHICAVECLAWSRDGMLLASGSTDGSICLWNGQTGAPMGKLRSGHAREVTCLDWSPDGVLLASGSHDGDIRLWDGKTGAPRGNSLTWHTQKVTCLAWSPDGVKLASGSFDHSVRLWNGQTGAPVGEPLLWHTFWVLNVTWSPDGSLLASGSQDGGLRLWDGKTGAPFGQPLIGHTASVDCVVWSTDGTRLTSGSSDRFLRFWDPAKTTCIAAIDIQMDMFDVRIVGDRWFALGSFRGRPQVVRCQLRQSLGVTT